MGGYFIMEKYAVGRMFTNKWGQKAVIIDTMAKKTKDPYDTRRNRRKIEFIDTGYIRWVSYGDLNNKNFRDNSTLKFSIGSIFVNTQGYKAMIIGKNIDNNKVRYIRFLNSNNILEVEMGNLNSGMFKDYREASVYGVGYSYKGATKNNRVYKTWSHMLERCYSPKSFGYKWYGAEGVKVCDRWLSYKKFEQDVKKLPGYDNFIKSKKPFEYTFDKDIIGDGMLYSPENCMFTNQHNQQNSRRDIKQIRSISRNGEVCDFFSMTKMCNKLGVHDSNVRKVLKGERKHTKGYVFKWL